MCIPLVILRLWSKTDSLVENGYFTTAFAIVHDTYDYYSVFDFASIVDKSFGQHSCIGQGGCFSLINWVGTSSITNAYMDAYVSFLANSVGLVSIDGGTSVLCGSCCINCVILLQLVYDCFEIGTGAHFHRWQYLIGSNATCFYPSSMLFNFNFFTRR